MRIVKKVPGMSGRQIPTIERCERRRLLQRTVGYVCNLPLHSNHVHHYQHLNGPLRGQVVQPEATVEIKQHARLSPFFNHPRGIGQVEMIRDLQRPSQEK